MFVKRLFLLKDIDSDTRIKILLTFAVIFVYRAMPGAGPGIQWWQIERQNQLWHRMWNLLMVTLELRRRNNFGLFHRC